MAIAGRKPITDPKNQRLTVCFTLGEAEKIIVLCEEQEISVSSWIRKLCLEALKKVVKD